MRSKLTSLEGALVAAPFLVLLALHDKLPVRIPIHWNLSGGVDGWTGRLGLFLAPLLSLGLIALLNVVPILDPKLRKFSETGRMPVALQSARLSVAALFDVIFAVQISVAYGFPIPATQILNSSILLLFIVLGNYLGNLRPNYLIGIRTPWTLENHQTWHATHRIGGRLMVFGALALLALQFVVSRGAFAFLLAAALVALVGWSFTYSWQHFRHHAARGSSAR